MPPPPPPHDYDPRRLQFRDGETGRLISRAAVRRLIDELVGRVQKDAARIAAEYERGDLTITQFEIAMRELLKSGHVVAASVGKGGRRRMTKADWGRVGAKLRDEYRYLSRFARKIEQGRISKLLTTSRAQLYAAGLNVSFYKAFTDEQVQGRAEEKPKVRRVLHATESCDGCRRYAAKGWISVNQMPLIGELECGNFCKCTLEFEDDTAADRAPVDRARVRIELRL